LNKFAERYEQMGITSIFFLSWAQDMVVWIGKCFALDEMGKAVVA